jgi:hypothetical protein
LILTKSIIDAVNLRQIYSRGRRQRHGDLETFVAGAPGIPALLIFGQNDKAGMDAVQRWTEKLPNDRQFEYPYRDREKDLDDQIKLIGLRDVRGIVGGSSVQRTREIMLPLLNPGWSCSTISVR